MFDTGADEFAPVNLWHRLTATGAVSTIRHARRHPIPLRDCIAFTLAMIAIGLVLGATL